MMNKKWIPALLLTAIFTTHAQQPNKEDQSISFGIVGDYGDNSKNEKKVADLISKRNPDFIITMGDNNYYDGCWATIDKNIGQYYSNFIGSYKGDYGQGATENRFFPSLGNHDWNALNKCLYKGDLPYLSYFSLPDNGRYYDFTKGPIHFYVIDSDSREPDGNKMHSRQYQWLKQKLKNSDSCFNVVYFHHAAYSSGDHASTKDMQWRFDELGADIVLSGHDHHYERILRDGIPYIVNGVGGAELRKIKDTVDGSQFHYDELNGYMMGYAHDNQLDFKFYNTENQIKDSFTLTKNCG